MSRLLITKLLMQHHQQLWLAAAPPPAPRGGARGGVYFWLQRFSLIMNYRHSIQQIESRAPWTKDIRSTRGMHGPLADQVKIRKIRLDFSGGHSVLWTVSLSNAALCYLQPHWRPHSVTFSDKAGVRSNGVSKR